MASVDAWEFKYLPLPGSEAKSSNLMMFYEGKKSMSMIILSRKGTQLQRFAGWLAQICDENSRMREFSIQNPHQKCAHAQIFVANL